MNKLACAAFIAIGALSIIGAAFFMYGVSLFDSAMNDVLRFDASNTPNLGLDIASAQQLARQAKGIITLAWIWSVMVILSSAGLIYFAAADMLRQRSVVVRKKA